MVQSPFILEGWFELFLPKFLILQLSMQKPICHPPAHSHSPVLPFCPYISQRGISLSGGAWQFLQIWEFHHTLLRSDDLQHAK